MFRYLSSSKLRLLKKRPPRDSDWVSELNIPDKASLERIDKTAGEIHKIKDKRERLRLFLAFRGTLQRYMTGK